MGEGEGVARIDRSPCGERPICQAWFWTLSMFFISINNWKKHNFEFHWTLSVAWLPLNHRAYIFFDCFILRVNVFFRRILVCINAAIRWGYPLARIIPPPPVSRWQLITKTRAKRCSSFKSITPAVCYFLTHADEIPRRE